MSFITLTKSGWVDDMGLQRGRWTTEADLLSERKSLLEVQRSDRINAGNGDDQLIGKGLQVMGSLSTGAGNDLLNTSFRGNGDDSLWLTGKLDLGDGDDTLTALRLGLSKRSSGAYGINSSGSLFTGAGRDSVESTEVLISAGSINLGDGDDQFKATGLFCNSRGLFLAGAGNDQLHVVHLDHSGTISMGDGDDLIRASRGTNTKARYKGINNNGVVNTGAGNDEVDSLDGGFRGAGRWILGDGDDLIRGFGGGQFEGGLGTDRLLLGAGTYTITASAVPERFQLRAMGGREAMGLLEIEEIGSALQPNERLPLKAGSLVVGNAGELSFTPI